MRLAPAPRLPICDTVQPVNREQAEALKSAGYATIVRYVDAVKCDPDSRGTVGGNLTRAELEMLLDVGLYVSLAQYYSTREESNHQGAKFSRAYGEERALAAAHNVRGLGIPQGVAVWYDLEQCPRASPAMVRCVLDGWSYRAVTNGIAPSLYYGSGLGSPEHGGYITGELLYQRPRFRSYGRAASAVPQIPGRGCCWIQTLDFKIAGLTIDGGAVCLDHRYQQDQEDGREPAGRFYVVAP